MLKKRLGIEAIERDKSLLDGVSVGTYFKVPSTLIIPEGVKMIGDFAFEFCTNLKEVKIPESVEEIKRYAFRYCLRLKKVKISKNVKEIGDCAFWCCTNLKKVIIPENIERVGDSAFGYYSKVEVEYVKEETRN